VNESMSLDELVEQLGDRVAALITVAVQQGLSRYEAVAYVCSLAAHHITDGVPSLGVQLAGGSHYHVPITALNIHNHYHIQPTRRWWQFWGRGEE